MLMLATPHAQSFLKNQPQRVRVDARVAPAAARPGMALTLTITATPGPGIHVYAPGNANYIPVAVTLTPIDGIAFEAPKYPKAEPYFFAPLAESVQVYSKPFTVRVPLKARTAASEKRSDSGTVTVKGTLDYQACDDKLCFPPQSAPFAATFTLSQGRSGS